MFECQVVVKIPHQRKINCSRRWKSFFHLIQHMKKDHPAEQNYHCLRCQKIFYSRQEETEHINSCPHRYPCDICARSFESDHGRTSHKGKAHFDEADSTCHICDKRFSRKSNLSKHMKTVHGIQSGQEKQTCALKNENQPKEEETVEYFMNTSELTPYTCGLCKFTVTHSLKRMKLHQSTRCRGRLESADEVWQAIFMRACPICCQPIRAENVQSHLRECKVQDGC